VKGNNVERVIKGAMAKIVRKSISTLKDLHTKKNCKYVITHAIMEIVKVITLILVGSLKDDFNLFSSKFVLMILELKAVNLDQGIRFGKNIIIEKTIDNIIEKNEREICPNKKPVMLPIINKDNIAINLSAIDDDNISSLEPCHL
jgi:hypothetical protein